MMRERDFERELSDQLHGGELELVERKYPERRGARTRRERRWPEEYYTAFRRPPPGWRGSVWPRRRT